MSRRPIIAALLLAVLAVVPAPSRAVGLVADLSNHMIGITTAFVGSNVLLYGALDEPGSDVAMVVQGPLETREVARKARVAGIWLQRDRLAFRDVPGYYAVASSRPLAEIARPDVLHRHGLVVERLSWQPVGARDRPREEIDAYRAALIRGMQRARLYTTKPGEIRFLGTRLFSTTVSFPANTPPGSYRVQVLNLRDGRVEGAQTSVLTVSKIGVEAELYDIAHHRSALYAIASIVLALGAGWIASAAFKRT
jgi:uncharacterized protein (TIGR02186 family)